MDFSVGKIVTSELVNNRYFYTGNFAKIEEKQRKPVSTGASRGGKGTIFWLIEITSNDSKIARLIIHNLKKYYLQKEDGIWGFEQTLKKINSALSRELENKNTSWVTHLNAILGLIQEDTVHLTSSGDICAYLFRENKISNILDVEESPPPQQTFVSVISGEIEKEDKVFLASSEFTSYMTIETLADNLRGKAEKSIAQIADYFREKNIRDINALVLDFSKNEMKVDTIYIDQLPESTPQKTLNFLKTAKELTKKGINALALAIGKVEYKILRKYLEKKNKDKVEKLEQKTKPPLLNSALKLEPGREKNHLKNFARPKNNLSFIKNNKKIFLIATAAVLLLVFGLSLFLRNKSNDNQDLAQNLLQAQSFYNDGISKENANQEEEAYDLFIKANGLATSAKDYPATANDALALLQKIQTEFNKITNATVISTATEAFIDFNKMGDMDLNQLFYLNNSLISYNKKNNEFYTVDLDKKEIENLFIFPDNLGVPQKAALFDLGNSYFFIKSDNNKYYTYNFADQAVDEAQKSGAFDWPQSLDILSYTNKVYFLQNKELDRFIYSASGFSEPSVAASSNTAIKSCAIDGSIYFLTSDNDIERYTGDQKDNFSLNKPFFFSDLEEINSIYTNSEFGYLILYQKNTNKLIIFDKSGDYYEQLVLSPDWDVNDVYANSQNELYILAQNKIYKISY